MLEPALVLLTASANVEPRKVVDGVLRVVNVLVHNKRCAAGIRCIPQPYLSDGAEFPEDVVHLLGGYLEW